MGLMFGSFGLGYLILFLGLLDGGMGPVRTTLKFVGILFMAIGVVGSAALQMHRRQKQRKREQKEHRELARR